MTMQQEIDTVREIDTVSFTGLGVIDERGAAVGTVVDVIYDDGEADPSWLVVDAGFLRGSHYVPTEGIYPTPGGELAVPYDKGWVRSAPKFSGDHELTYETRRRLSTHYGDSYDWWSNR